MESSRSYEVFRLTYNQDIDDIPGGGSNFKLVGPNLNVKVTPICQKSDFETVQFLQSTRNIKTNIYTYSLVLNT